MSTQQQFAICVQNEGYPASLELWKVYRVLPDDKAAKHHLMRVVDESGEDYLYDQSWFVPIKLPQAAKESKRPNPKMTRMGLLLPAPPDRGWRQP
jgi:hypothetical protein